MMPITNCQGTQSCKPMKGHIRRSTAMSRYRIIMAMSSDRFFLLISLAVVMVLSTGFSDSFQPSLNMPKRTPSALPLSSGPKAEGRRKVHRRTTTTCGGSKGPKPPRQSRENPRKAPSSFDGRVLTASQTPNENATPMNLEQVLSNGQARCITENIVFANKVRIEHFTFLSLDDLFGKEVGLSDKFNSDRVFREELRSAIRQDIFDTTPFYTNLSAKAASLLMLPDSSLEGSWKIPDSMDRMKKTTAVLSKALGENAPTGDELFQAIGNLCGKKPSTHFIDIYGVQDRNISHSFHLDSGRSVANSTRTVLWGWPREDQYDGCGVFSHVIPLEYECWAPEDHPRMEPVLFDGTFEEQYIVRPRFQPGRELLIFRDVDVLHSAPDVTYRTSVMRFM
eukprot:scaffold22589_cov138-Cylindrotheca_fusiformis.AAC.10